MLFFCFETKNDTTTQIHKNKTNIILETILISSFKIHCTAITALLALNEDSFASSDSFAQVVLWKDGIAVSANQNFKIRQYFPIGNM